MAISRTKEPDDKEQANSIITSAKGTYSAVILRGRTGEENSTISDVDVKSNLALHEDMSVEGSYYVWYWCPSVDGEYRVQNRSYERVNVPKFNEVDGKELLYVVGDIIDISFDEGHIGAPRFVRHWGLVHHEQGIEAIKSNVIGIKTGNFPTILQDALNLYSSQVGTPAYNLYPYLCKILTGNEEPTNGQYSTYDTESFLHLNAWIGGSQSGDAINNRFTYSFLPFSSYFTYAYVK